MVVIKILRCTNSIFTRKKCMKRYYKTTDVKHSHLIKVKYKLLLSFDSWTDSKVNNVDEMIILFVNSLPRINENK